MPSHRLPPCRGRLVLGLAVMIAGWTGLAASAAALERCLALAEAPQNSMIHRASLRPAGLGPARAELAQLKTNEARLTYIGHSTFLIESAQGIRAATDYNDYVKPSVVPEIVTMNRAHDSHFTNYPEPSIRHVLRGWSSDGGPIQHDVAVGDVRVRNIPTHIRGWDGAAAQFGNSIFIFEVGELCIAHLGHLHHTLKPEQLAALGQMDVVLVPVDGTYTMDLDGMIEVLKEIRAPLMIPMHYFSRFTLDRFLARVRDVFEVVESSEPAVTLSRAALPRNQQVLVLPGR